MASQGSFARFLAHGPPNVLPGAGWSTRLPAKAPNSMAAVSAEGKTLCVLMRRHASFHALFTAVLGSLGAVFVYPAPRTGHQPAVGGILRAWGVLSFGC